MKIGIDGSRAEGRKTGVGWYSYQIIKNLFLLSEKDKFKRDKFFIYTREDLDFKNKKNLKFKRLKWPLKFIWTHIRLNWELLFHPVDILFVPGASIPLFYFKKSVTVIHDLGFKKYPQAYSLWQKFYYNLVHFWNIKVADIIITPSEFTKQEILKFYNIKKDKIKVVPLGFNKNNLKSKENSDKVLKRYNIKKPYFLYVGRLEKKKNITNLVKAYKRFKKKNKNTSLVLAGKSGFGYKKIKPLIKKEHSIKELGYVSNKDLSSLYSNALAFILPSFYEGFGIPVLEAMANKVAVILSENGSLKEVGGEAALYFKPENIQKLSSLMEKIVNHQDLRERLKEKGLKRVNQYSWKKCTKQILKILVSLKS